VIHAFSPDSPLASLVVPSPNHGERAAGKRADCIVLHYTGMPSADAALRWLADPQSQVSAHYVVREDGAIVQMVEESRRAWHAGKGSWLGETDINSVSIGIEIVNTGHPGSDPSKSYPDFPDGQIAAVIALVKNIVMRRRLDPRRILAHSDIAPRRKIDPGERFPWARLALHGLGQFIEPSPIRSGKKLAHGDEGEGVMHAKTMLRMLGFQTDETPLFDEELVFIVKAFQRHWRPRRIDGVFDLSTRLTLKGLLGATG
jgi:N-acetylmuramoyl-L-alanine amidase